MKQEIKYTLSPIVLLALRFAIISEYCQPTPIENFTSYIRNEIPFNPYCYVKSFNPEQPEIQMTITTTSSVSSSAVVGTATVSTSTL